MNAFPTEPKKIMERIRRYERALRKDIKTFGFIEDGAGKRYLLGALYLILGDAEGAVQSYKWLEQVLPDDMGEPFDHLCWSLALYRAGDTEAASRKLLRTMLHNLYLLPALLGLRYGMATIGRRRATLTMRQPKYSLCGMSQLWNGPGRCIALPGSRKSGTGISKFASNCNRSRWGQNAASWCERCFSLDWAERRPCVRFGTSCCPRKTCSLPSAVRDAVFPLSS